MTDEWPGWTVRRILVGLDASAPSAAALQAAVSLASRLHAELLAMYIEDENLARLAELPFAHELGAFSAQRRTLDPSYMDNLFKAQATRARHALQRSASAAELRWSFEIRRGSVARQLLLAAAEADLVVVGRSAIAHDLHTHIGSTARHLVDSAACAVLLTAADSLVSKPAVILFDGSEASLQALLVGARWYGDALSPLTIMLVQQGDGESGALEQRAREILGYEHVEARFVTCAAAGTFALVQALQGEDCGLLIVSTEALRSCGIDPLHVLQGIERPVLLIH